MLALSERAFDCRRYLWHTITFKWFNDKTFHCFNCTIAMPCTCWTSIFPLLIACVRVCITSVCIEFGFRCFSHFFACFFFHSYNCSAPLSLMPRCAVWRACDASCVLYAVPFYRARQFLFTFRVSITFISIQSHKQNEFFIVTKLWFRFGCTDSALETFRWIYRNRDRYFRTAKLLLPYRHLQCFSLWIYGTREQKCWLLIQKHNHEKSQQQQQQHRNNVYVAHCSHWSNHS